ncbi:multidrug efflux SMR transporter [Thermoleophilia bacterium SCSIO 60948]|nr:multidrug efflux SMR transporter [Thermoleophilia bacterium SCSIO 60948]
MPYLLLAIAIALEVFGSSLLKATEGLTRPLPTVAMLGAYALSIFLLTQVVRELEIGFTYAVWAGVGTVAIATIGVLALGEAATLAKFGGVLLVASGVVLLNLSGSH